MADIVDVLNQISETPSQQAEFDIWLEMGSAIQFILDNTRQSELVACAYSRGTFIHALLVPTSSVTPPDNSDLMSWNCTPMSSWGICSAFSEPRSFCISPPLDHTGSRTLDQGEQIVFSRQFLGRSGNTHYFEILQKFTHVFDLHYMEERNAYCRLDKHGDIQELVRVIEVPAKDGVPSGNAVVFNRDILDEYLALTNSSIIQTFDFTRYRPGHFNGWHEGHSGEYQTLGAMCYRLHVEPGYASYLRGFHLVHLTEPMEAVVRRLDFSAVEERQYASFIAHDWKNKCVKEISCAPASTANYFTHSDLPFELSPAFFRAEVLLKYKADSQKYKLVGRSIHCRGAWSLETYDINDAGQVHTYLVYLRSLPYEEQLYWKSYNEEPKAPISARAMTTDFVGTWHSEYDPLPSIKEAADEMKTKQVPWWTLRSETLPDQLHYPVTSSPDEWSSEIMNLDQFIVEGFEVKWLRDKAKSLGRSPDIKLASLKLLAECLIGLGFADDQAHKIVAPLKEAHDLRSKIKGHASGSDAVAIRKRILKEHGSFKAHYRALCKRCDESIRTIMEAFKEPA